MYSNDCVRRGKAPTGKVKRDNVIDMAVWRAEHQPEEVWEWEGQEERPARRERRRHMALMGGEWLATLSVIVVMALMVVKILLF